MGCKLCDLIALLLQGQFPHGIDILSTCDYFAVGNRISCYLDLRYVLLHIYTAVVVVAGCNKHATF